MRDQAVAFINSSTDITGLTASGTGAGMDRVTIISDVGGAFSNDTSRYLWWWYSICNG